MHKQLIASSQIRLILLAVLFSLFLPQALHAQISSISRVSVASDGTEADASSDGAAVNSDGSVIAYRSSASDLVSSDTNGVKDVFVFDVDSATTSRLSVSGSGIEGDNASGGDLPSGTRPALSLSFSGRYVAFPSDATNLVIGDRNLVSDIFLVDRQSATITRESLAFSSLEVSEKSEQCAVSEDGPFIAFSSLASEFVTSDANNSLDIFRRDVAGFDTSAESEVFGGSGFTGNADSTHPSISSDGNFIAFASDATNLVSSDTNGATDIFLRDVAQNQTIRVSVSSEGTEGNGDSLDPFISSDGRYVVFTSNASNLVTDDTNKVADIFIYDSQTATTELVSARRTGGSSNGASKRASVSTDGRYVAFISEATNLLTGDTNGVADAFLRDRLTSKTTRVSLSSSGKQSTEEPLDVMVSANGKIVVFSSTDPALVSSDTNRSADVFRVRVAPILTPDTVLVDAPTVTVSASSATITVLKFAGASLEQQTSSLARTAMAIKAAARRNNRLNVRYDIEVAGTGDIAGERRRRVAKRNEITFRNLPAGTYTVNYKMLIKRKRRTISSTNTSPTAGFTVGG